VFVTGSDGKSQEVFALESATGKVRWHAAVPRGSSQEVPVSDDTGHAANSPATDGTRVYAVFASGDLAAFDYSGKRLWSKSLGTLDSSYGYASSLAVWDGKVIVQWDHGADSQGKSALIGLDGATGKQVWRTPRPVGAAWASPVVVDGRIFTSSMPLVMAHDAASGKELWRVELMHGDVAPSPVVVNDVVYVANDQAVAAAINAKTGQVIWKTEEGRLPDIVSPLCDGKFLLLSHGGGDLTCLDAATGKQVWEESQDASVQASPILADGLVYWTGADGVTSVFALKESF
jgi:outer membrane protein assembly factor BamB